MGRRSSNPIVAIRKDIDQAKTVCDRILKYAEQALDEYTITEPFQGKTALPLLTMVTTSRAIAVGLTAQLDELNKLATMALECPAPDAAERG